MPVEARKACAFRAMLRGSREKASPVSGSWMKKFTTRVLAVRNGSRYDVVGSGNSDMSDSWIAWKPRIDDPSKLRPLSKTLWSNDDTGTVKCCMMPGRSQNRTSTISTPSSLMYLSSSSLLANIRPPRPSRGPVCWLSQGDLRRAGHVRRRTSSSGRDLCNVGGGSFLTVTGLFRRRNRSRPGSWGTTCRGYPDRVPTTELPFETASWGRRVLALVVDYAACWGVMLLIYGGAWFGNGSLPSLYLMLLFIAESALLMALSGGSFGQLATRLRVVRIDGSGRPLTLLMALLRQVLICLVIPPLVFRPDGRGLHDLICASATVSFRVPDRGPGVSG